jgi:predicted Fe-S protein YdhL (DUF1289 family)
MGKKVKSPCIDLCKIDKASGWCRGCFRSKDEIKRWKKLGKKERRAILAELPARRKAG